MCFCSWFWNYWGISESIKWKNSKLLELRIHCWHLILGQEVSRENVNSIKTCQSLLNRFTCKQPFLCKNAMRMFIKSSHFSFKFEIGEVLQSSLCLDLIIEMNVDSETIPWESLSSCNYFVTTKFCKLSVPFI